MTDEEEDDIHCLKAAPGKGRSGEKKFPQIICVGCGRNHLRAACRFKNASCLRCGRKSHLARVYLDAQLAPMPPMGEKYPKRQQRYQPRQSKDCFTILKDQAETVIGQASLSLWKKIFLTIQLEGVPYCMEVDSGSSLSLVSWSTIKWLVPRITKRWLKPCSLRLRDYQGNNIPILGSYKARVKFKSFWGRLKLIIVDISLPRLLGLN